MQLCIAEVLDSSKKVENQLVSFAAVGVSMDEEAVQEATSTCQAADKIIQVIICHAWASVVMQSLEPMLETTVLHVLRSEVQHG